MIPSPLEMLPADCQPPLIQHIAILQNHPYSRWPLAAIADSCRFLPEIIFPGLHLPDIRLHPLLPSNSGLILTANSALSFINLWKDALTISAH